MNSPTLRLRQATLDDVPFVAWVIVTAIGIEQPAPALVESVTTMCRRDDVLYSWRNTIVAEKNGQPVGALTQYDGARYLKMRQVTFPLIQQACGIDYSDMDLETHPGEYYLDSMAVLPEHRGQGIATALLKDGIARATAAGITQCSMIVSPENPEAQKLYESLGFHHVMTINAFHEEYRKMVRKNG